MGAQTATAPPRACRLACTRGGASAPLPFSLSRNMMRRKCAAPLARMTLTWSSSRVSDARRRAARARSCPAADPAPTTFSMSSATLAPRRRARTRMASASVCAPPLPAATELMMAERRVVAPAPRRASRPASDRATRSSTRKRCGRCELSVPLPPAPVAALPPPPPPPPGDVTPPAAAAPPLAGRRKLLRAASQREGGRRSRVAATRRRAMAAGAESASSPGLERLRRSSAADADVRTPAKPARRAAPALPTRCPAAGGSALARSRSCSAPPAALKAAGSARAICCKRSIAGASRISGSGPALVVNSHAPQYPRTAWRICDATARSKSDGIARGTVAMDRRLLIESVNTSASVENRAHASAISSAAPAAWAACALTSHPMRGGEMTFSRHEIE